ncbi:MAG: glutamine--fructose-6-phosphate transaminase (isomerizing) [Clostridia bacterium]|nr:glutamine--fructose-6-phosphate transaminase (isomerizing) [Clostridia bacterium]
MCGIVGYTGNREAAPILISGLKKLEYRGYDSAGVAVFHEGEIKIAKSHGKIANLDALTSGGASLPGFVGVGHTRWATHGAPNDVNAHPHLSDDGRFAVVHNGIIENYSALRDELVASGYEFKSDTDTEVISNLLEYCYDGDAKSTVMKATARLKGSYVLGVICRNDEIGGTGRIFAMREAAPLILGLGVGENYFASDVTALVEHTKNIIYLDDGEFAELTPQKITVYGVTGEKIDKPVSHIMWDVKAAERGGYEHFMIKEIMEEPAAVKATIDPRIKDGRVVFEDFSFTSERMAKIGRIIITACGSASYAGEAGREMIEALCRIPVTVELASELRYRSPIIDESTLVIVVSQSGETADTIAALKESKARGAETIAIVNVVGSSIAKLADHVIYTWAGPEIAVATTKGYATQTAVFALLSIYFAELCGKIDGERYKKLVSELEKMPSKIQRAIDINHHIPYLSKRYADKKDVFFIGRGFDFAVCREGALKLKEISYIHAEAYAAGELKHGTIALIENGSLVVALACSEELYDKTASNVEEVKARGAKVLAVVHEDNKRAVSTSDDFILVPETEPLFTPIAEIIPLQLFAYYVAKENGCDIDKPKNLAKSVTVE